MVRGEAETWWGARGAGPQPLSLVGKCWAGGCLRWQVGSEQGLSGDKMGSQVRATNCKKEALTLNQKS